MSGSGDTLSHPGASDRASGTPRRRAHLILALESDRPLAPSVRFALDGLDEVVVGRGAERSWRRVREDGKHRLVVAVPDRWMSNTHARLERRFAEWTVIDAGSKNGTRRNGTPCQHAVLAPGDLCELGRTFFLFQEGEAGDPEKAIREASDARAPVDGMATFAPFLERRFRALEKVAPSSLPILIGGESGTGKELVARAVHAASARTGSFVAVNCGALPATLAESELFGYRRGAFSGATEDRAGLVRSAEGGTLFLDEIGDLPLPSQAALLRVLQEREVLPLGATRPVPIDVRFVAATHRDLPALVGQGRFRQDLLARIAGFGFALPPLRERREDLGALISGILWRELGEKAAEISFTVEAARALFHYRWPLNIRELQKCVHAAALLAHGAIRLEHLPSAVTAVAPPVPEPPALTDEDAARKGELVALLAAHKGNVSAVARAMGKERKQIQRWLKRYRLVDRKGD